MTEEEATYVTAEGKMRAALEVARHTLVTDSGLSAFCDDAPNEVFHIDNKNAIQQIDDALAIGTDDIRARTQAVRSPESEELEGQIDRAFHAGYKQRETEYGLKAKHVQELISDAYKEGKTDRDNETAIQLIELPASIKSQSSTIAALTADIEKLRLSIANIKNRALELVLSATNEGKPMYSNDKARTSAVETILREDKLYLDNCDEVGRKESELRREQIQLEFLHNSFSAYRAIAGMQGV